MTSHDVEEWLAYDALEPFGQPRVDMLLGTVASQFYNAHRASGSQPLDWWHFAPNVNMPPEKVEKEEPLEVQNAKVLDWVKAFNARQEFEEERTKKAKAIMQKFADAAKAQRGG